jgi:adhesin transport system outer membrane protein
MSIVRHLIAFSSLTLTMTLVVTAAGAANGNPAGLGLALQAALNNNPIVAGKKAEIAAQSFTVKSAQSGRYPSLSGEIDKQDDGLEYASVSLKQPIFAFGKINVPIKIATAQYQLEALHFLQLQRQLVESTAITCVKVGAIRSQLQVVEQNITEHQRLYDQIKRRCEGQLASEADVRLAYSRLTQAMVQRQRLIGELDVAQSSLRSLTMVEIPPEVLDTVSAPLLPDEATLKIMALENSADVLYKSQQIEIARYNITMEKISSTPTLSVQAERYFRDSTYANETQVGLVFEGSVGGAGLGIVNRVKAAGSRLTAATQDLNAARNDTKLRIATLLANLAVEKVLQQSQQESVAAIAETMESYLRQYDIGRKSWLDVLNIQSELTGQRLQLVQSESGVISSSLQIAAMTGQLDSLAGIEPLQ